MRTTLLAALGAVALAAAPARSVSPVPPSPALAGIVWTPTGLTFGPGGDFWPTSTRPDGRVEAAWGDGALGCATKVSYGTGHLPAAPGATFTRDGCGPPGSGNGKLSALLSVGPTLWAVLITNEARWAAPPPRLLASTGHGAHWRRVPWSFPPAMKPLAFVQDGPADDIVYLLA